MASIASITQVLSPNFSKIKTKQEIIHELKHGLTYLLIPAALFILLYITPNQIFYLFFTKKFAQTATITKALSLAFIPYVFWQLPLLFILYTLKKPFIIFYANLTYFIIVSVGCYIFIPKLGVYAPPYVIAAASVVGIMITLVYSLLEIKKLVKSFPVFQGKFTKAFFLNQMISIFCKNFFIIIPVYFYSIRNDRDIFFQRAFIQI